MASVRLKLDPGLGGTKFLGGREEVTRVVARVPVVGDLVVVDGHRYQVLRVVVYAVESWEEPDAVVVLHGGVRFKEEDR